MTKMKRIYKNVYKVRDEYWLKLGKLSNGSTHFIALKGYDRMLFCYTLELLQLIRKLKSSKTSR